MSKQGRRKIVLFNPMVPQHTEPIVPYALLSISKSIAAHYDIKILVSRPGLDLKDEILSHCSGALCFGLTCITGPQVGECIRMAKAVKERYPDVPIIWGGWHPTIMTHQTLESEFVDIVVKGQGEVTFKELVAALDGDGDLSGIEGVSYKKGGKIFHNQDRGITNLNEFPEYPYHLIDVEKFIHDGSRYCNVDNFGTRSIDYITSIGCPNECQFCATPVSYKRRWYGKSVDMVIKELTFLKGNYGVDSIILRDDNMCVNKKRLVSLCNVLIENGLNLNLGFADGTADQLSKYTDDDWRLLRDAGFRHFFVGVESGDPETLTLMRKRITPEQVVKVAEKCADYDIAVSFSFMAGTPLKNRQMDVAGVMKDIGDNLNLINRMEKVARPNRFAYSLNFYMPFPGSDLYELSKECGFKEPDKLEGWINISSKKNSLLKETKDIESYLKVISHVLRYRLNKNKFHIKSLKDLAQYLFHYAATVRFRFMFFSLPVDFWIINWWSERSMRRLKGN